MSSLRKALSLNLELTSEHQESSYLQFPQLGFLAFIPQSGANAGSKQAIGRRLEGEPGLAALPDSSLCLVFLTP